MALIIDAAPVPPSIPGIPPGSIMGPAPPPIFPDFTPLFPPPVLSGYPALIPPFPPPTPPPIGPLPPFFTVAAAVGPDSGPTTGWGMGVGANPIAFPDFSTVFPVPTVVFTNLFMYGTAPPMTPTTPPIPP